LFFQLNNAFLYVLSTVGQVSRDHANGWDSESKIIIVTPLARRRFAIATAERTKQARNRQTETNIDCGETISKPTPIIKERNDHPMGFQAFGGSIGRAVGNTPLRNGPTWRSLMLRPRFAFDLICTAEIRGSGRRSGHGLFSFEIRSVSEWWMYCSRLFLANVLNAWIASRLYPGFPQEIA
jgi:hypothetical protein